MLVPTHHPMMQEPGPAFAMGHFRFGQDCAGCKNARKASWVRCMPQTANKLS